MARTAHRPTQRRIARRSTTKRTIRKVRGTAVKPHFLKLLILAASVVLGLCLVQLVLWFFVFPSLFLTNLPNKNSVYVSNTLDSENNIILFAQFNENAEKSKVFAIDGTVEVAVPNGYGTYALESLYPLLTMDNQEEETVRSIMSRALTVPVDELVVGEPILAEGFTKESAQASVLSALRTDPIKNVQEYLALLRMYFLISSQSDIPFFSTAEVTDLTDSAALVLADGEETCAVAVVNTTKTPKLAATTAALLEKNGVYVIREDSIPNTLEATSILEKSSGATDSCAGLASKLQSFFPATTTKSLQNAETQRYRADIVILLGEDVVTAK